MTEFPEDEYLVAMNRAFQMLTRGPDAILAASGLGRAHHRALFAVRRKHGIPVGEAAKLLGVTNQAFHKTLAPLLSQQLVRTETSTDDARVKCLMLTPAGKRLEARITGMQRAVFRHVTQTTSRKGMQEWLTIMETIARCSAER